MRNTSTVILASVLGFIFADTYAGQYGDDHDGNFVSEREEILEDRDSERDWGDSRIGDDAPEGGVFYAGPGYPGWVCGVCRDPETHPMDFAAVAYNAYFGQEPWALESILGIPFRIYNLDAQWVVVWFDNVFLNMPTLLPGTMTVVLRLQTGEILRMEVLQGGPDLPFGDPNPEADTNAGGDGGGGDDGDDGDDFEGYDDSGDIGEYDDDDSQVDFPVGIVEIEDPDENGNFPEFEQEL